MIAQLPGKKMMTMDLHKISSFLDIFQTYMSRSYTFFKDNKNNSKIMLLVAGITSLLAIYFAVQLYSDITTLNGKTSDLINLSSYDTRTLEADAITQTILKNSDTIKDLLQENKITK
jgi:hypothetical protein